MTGCPMSNDGEAEVFDDRRTIVHAFYESIEINVPRCHIKAAERKLREHLGKRVLPKEIKAALRGTQVHILVLVRADGNLRSCITPDINEIMEGLKSGDRVPTFYEDCPICCGTGDDMAKGPGVPCKSCKTRRVTIVPDAAIRRVADQISGRDKMGI